MYLLFLLKENKNKRKLVRENFLLNYGISELRCRSIDNAQTDFRPLNLFNTRALYIESWQSYSCWSTRTSKGEKRGARIVTKNTARFVTWPLMVPKLRGTISARKHKALFLSSLLFLFLRSSLFMPAIGRNLVTHRCTPCGLCDRVRQLHCSAYFISQFINDEA